MKQLLELLSTLRAMGLMYQNMHWTVSGADFYQLHLLFQRLYEALDVNIDVLAEKIVGIYGSDSINTLSQMQLMTSFLEGLTAVGDPVQRGLVAESYLQRKLEMVKKSLESSEELTLGLEDYLSALASAQETSLYLLGQQKTH